MPSREQPATDRGLRSCAATIPGPRAAAALRECFTEPLPETRPPAPRAGRSACVSIASTAATPRDARARAPPVANAGSRVSSVRSSMSPSAREQVLGLVSSRAAARPAHGLCIRPRREVRGSAQQCADSPCQDHDPAARGRHRWRRALRERFAPGNPAAASTSARSQRLMAIGQGPKRRCARSAPSLRTETSPKTARTSAL